MKKILCSLFLVSLLIVSGCTNNSKEKNEGTKDKTKAYNLYENAIDQTNEENSFKINQYIENSTSYVDEDVKDSDYEYSSVTDFNILANNVNEGNLEFKINGAIKINGTSIDMTSYLKDGYLYQDSLDTKTKSAYTIGEEEYTLHEAKIKKSDIDKAYYEESENGITIITFYLKFEVGENYLSDSLDQDQLSRINEDNFDKLKMTIKIGKDGYLKESKTEISFNYEEESATLKSSTLTKFTYKSFSEQNIQWPDFSLYSETSN